MKKLILLHVFLLSVLFSFSAYLKNFPVELKQPDGTVIHCFITGDEFHRRLHDMDNYTIVQDPTSGYYVYAFKEGEKLLPSQFIVGKLNSNQLDIAPGYDVSNLLIEENINVNLKSGKELFENPTKGNFNNIVISIRFSDQEPSSLELQDYENKFNSLTGISLKSYYRKVSDSQLNVNSYFFPFVQDQKIIEYQDIHPRSYYIRYNEQTNPDGYLDEEWMGREQTLFTNALKSVEAQIIESSNDFDLNNDGVIDNIAFIIQGNPDSWGKLLWPQTSSFINTDLRINGLSAGSYNKILSSMFESSVINHEFFHTLGAPDLYRYYDFSFDPVGPWDIMGWSGENFMTTFMKWRYGKWLDNLPEITMTGTYKLKDVANSPFACYKIASPNKSDEYFIVEYRKQDGLFDASIPGSGLLIYRINESMDGLGNANGAEDEVYVYRPAGTKQSNGIIEMAHFSDDFNRIEFNDLTDPSDFLSDLTDGGIQISGISSIDDEMIFDVSFNSSVLKLQSPNGNESWKTGAVKEIQWSGKNVSNINIHYSFDGGATWDILIEEIPESQKKYSWELPNAITSRAMIRISDSKNNLIRDESDSFFTVRDVDYITETEPNDIFSIANVLEIGDSVKSVLNYGYDTDYYKFYVDSKKTVSIKIKFEDYKYSTGTSKFIELFGTSYNFLIRTVYDDLIYTIEHPGWYYIKYAFAIDNETFICPYELVLINHNTKLPEVVNIFPYSVNSNTARLSATIKTHGLNTNLYFLYEEYDPNGEIHRDSVKYTNMVEAKNNPYNNLNNEIILSELITELNPNTYYICKLKAQNEFCSVLSSNSVYFKTPPVSNNWTRLNYGFPNAVSGLSFISENIGSLLLSDHGNFDGLPEYLTAIMRTENAGGIWAYQFKQVPPICYFPLSHIEMIDNETVYAWGYGGIHKSTNGGENWEAVNLTTDMVVYDIEFITPEHWIVAGALRLGNGRDGKMVQTKDGGKTWEGNDDVYDGEIKKIAFDGNGIGMYTSWSSKKIYRTKDFGQNWEIVYEINDFNPMDVVYNSGKWFVCGYDGVIYSSNEGDNWIESEVLPVTNNRPFYWHYNLTNIDFSDSLNGVTAGHDGVIYRTRDGGISWFPDESGTLNDIQGVEFIENTIWAVGFDGLILKKEILKNTAPVADAGMNQEKEEGATVILDGTGSSDPEGDELSYRWTASEGIELSLSTTAHPEFTAPEVKFNTTLTFTLIVNDGTIDSEPDQVTITIKNVNKIPVADAGLDQEVDEGASVILNGTGSKDMDGDELSFQWTAPEGIELSSYATANPQFNAPQVTSDTTFTFTLVVNDGSVDSEPDKVIITVKKLNSTPVADAGIDQEVEEGATVTLDGTGSSDSDGDGLTFYWTSPEGIELSSLTIARPEFIAPQIISDTAFTFILTVNDGICDSEPAQVTVTIKNVNITPVADAGVNQEVEEGTTVILDGTGSMDLDGNELGFQWTAPGGIELSSTTIACPEFIAPQVTIDTDFIFTLIVSNGNDISEPDKVTITVKKLNSTPVADAGIDQEVEEGATVTLDGTGSSDSDGDGLTFHWTAPEGIELSSYTIVRPDFIAPEVDKDTIISFSLSVNDGIETSSYSFVNVTIKNIITNSENFKENFECKIYPNPSTGIINFEVYGYSGNKMKIIVVNPLGKEVLQQYVYKAGIYSLDLSDQVSGIYLVRISINNNVVVKKMIIY